MASTAEQLYRYAVPSAVGGRDVRLSTSGGRAASGEVAHPRFFEGFVARGEQVATALLVVARVARSRFYVPPGMLAAVLAAADPVVTSNGDRLRFESFSACCGVYARLDVLPGALDGGVVDTGTTNVDFNPPMRTALAGITGPEPLHLAVGQDVTVTTLDGAVTERRVPLPQRWVKGFAEVQVAASSVAPAFEVPVVEARRFVRALPRTSSARTVVWAAPAGRGLRLTGHGGDGAVGLRGPERLRVVEPVLRFARSVRASTRPGADEPAPSVWEVELDDARLVVALSPEASRGFSGEGGVLRDLADPDAVADAELVGALLAHEPVLDVDVLARRADRSPDRVRRALGRLGAAGRVGYDNAAQAYFHRELPYDPALLGDDHPRLRDAAALVAAGAVRLDGDLAHVRSGDVEHVVRLVDGARRCTCPWFAKHGTGRGPCKHVLAVELASRG